MLRTNLLFARAVCAVVVCILFVPGVANAIPILFVHDFLDRTYISADIFADSSLGNGWTRTDTFTNIDLIYSVRLDSVELLFLNPDDFGYSDMDNGNAAAVLAAAEASDSNYMFGVNFSVLEDPPVMNWTNSGKVVNFGGVWLGPGEYFELETIAHNEIMGMAGDPIDNWDLIGEVETLLIIGISSEKLS